MRHFAETAAAVEAAGAPSVEVFFAKQVGRGTVTCPARVESV